MHRSVFTVAVIVEYLHLVIVFIFSTFFSEYIRFIIFIKLPGAINITFAPGKQVLHKQT